MSSHMVVQNMPDKYLAEFNAARAYIANITEVEFSLNRTYGNYIIPGKQLGEAFSLTEIQPRKGKLDMGDKHVSEFPIFPEDVAKDLVRQINADAGYDSFLGVFMCGPDGPTDVELADAKAKLRKFYMWCVQQGDDEWQRTGRIIMIPDLWKRASTMLNLNREWCAEIQPNLECPGCGSKIKPGIAVCRDCGAVLDREKALALGILREEQVPDPDKELVPVPMPRKKSAAVRTAQSS